MIKSSQIVAFVGAIVLIIILCFAPITKKENMDSKITVAIEKVNSKNPMEGILMLKEIAKEYPNNTTPLFHLGMFSIQTNQFEKAINYFTNVLNIDSNKIEAHLHLGDVFLEIGDTVKAINELQRYIAKETDQSKVDEANILVNKLN